MTGAGDIAFSIRGLSKSYTIARSSRGRPSFRETVVHRLRRPFHRPQTETLWALKDVSFDVRKGEVVGIIGRNGAGKSTLLKILSRITEPAAGEVDVYGRIGSLLEVGTGFHPELTGRENIYLNGAILGMRRAEITHQFDAIVAFAEVEKFLDVPVKRYSSGMYVRLAFAVAAHLDPEILVVDEVLAVGDAQFQRKCLGKMQSIASEGGRTVLFVSHNMAAIVAMCTQAIVMQNGQKVFAGNVQDAVERYNSDQQGPTGDRRRSLRNVARSGSGRARFTSVQVTPLAGDGGPVDYLQSGSDLRIEVELEAEAATEATNVAVIIYDSAGVRLVDLNTALKGCFISLAAGEVLRVSFDAQDVLLKPGTYTIGLWLGRGGIEEIDSVENALNFSLEQDPNASSHTEVFPGPYQCRFTTSLESGGAGRRDPSLQEVF